jgi:hypothetical protein
MHARTGHAQFAACRTVGPRNQIFCRIAKFLRVITGDRDSECSVAGERRIDLVLELQGKPEHVEAGTQIATGRRDRYDGTHG